ncbi:MAG: twin arginine-targeting protein translocase TatC [Lentisphaerae bacterium RIFOXYA12_FULL_48_11]|nr:MAG: twin arginine-targeting protein translocase TatC [Lentisphaerae bacterium RIFOXYA12_FULL_48_11]
MPIKTTGSPADDTEDDGQTKPFMEHLEDLRRTIIRAAMAFAVGMCIAIPAAPWILYILKLPLKWAGKDPSTFLQVLEVTGGLSLATQTVFWAGLLISAPFIIYFIWEFVFPGLTKREQGAITSSIGFALVLFILGVLTGYYLALAPGIKVMIWFSDWMGVNVTFFRATDYIRFVVILLLSFGICFELPIILLILGQMGLVTSRQLRDKRSVAIVVVLIIAAVVTPTTDPFTQLVMAVPMCLLYELCIWILWSKERKAAKEST